MITLSIIIPFLNEEKTIWIILDKVIKLDLEYKKEIILVNDWSNDKSEEIIKTFLIKHLKNIDLIYIKNDKNYWKWYSLKEWFKKATWDYYIIQDADLEYNPNDYIKLINKLENEKLDIVYWSRTRWYIKNWFKYSYLSFLLWGLLVSFLTSLATFKIITDEPTCYKLFRWNLKKLLIYPEENWFEWEPAITVYLIKRWYKYWELAISYFPRKSIDWKKIKWIDWVKAIKTIIKWRFKNYN